MPNDMMNIKQAAEILGIGTSTVYRLCDQNTIPHIKIGGSIRLRRSTLENFLTAQESTALQPKK